jgi:uncharacterized membrane protein
MFYTPIALVSAFGIYLGRFLRLNSWDLIVNFHETMTTIIQALNIDTLEFVIVYGALQIAVLLAFHAMRKL